MSEVLVNALTDYTNDPLGFVACMFPWGVKETELEHFHGPEQWQTDVLDYLGQRLRAQATYNIVPDGEEWLAAVTEAILIAAASGHGVGKSALVSWIILWSISTFEHTRGVVTANTETQLKTKTWAELGKWHRLFLAKELFKLTATAIFSANPENERTWRIDMVPWSERNTEAFAGLHNQARRIILIMDEASAIPDVIWETSEGALTDKNTQIIWCVFGNPTRNVGRFRECWSRFKNRWWRKQVDSRQVSLTDHVQIKKWAEDYGDDSDFFRIRVKGIFPRIGEMEFISGVEVDASMDREVVVSITDPLACGVDVARYGSNASVLYFRKGRDGRNIPRRRYQGLSTVDVATKVHEAFFEYHLDGIFIDGTGVGGGVVDNVRNMHLYCWDVQFGGADDVGGGPTGNIGERYANKRCAMWGAMRSWIRTGALPLDADLKSQLVGITYTYNLRGEIQLEKKEDMMKRGLPSPDDADALALTFAYPLAPHEMAGGDHPKKSLVVYEYDPFETVKTDYNPYAEVA